MDNITEESSKEEQKESTCLSPDTNLPKENINASTESLSSKPAATESESKPAVNSSTSTTNLKAEDAAGISLTSVNTSVESLDSSADVLIMDVSPEKPVTVTSSPLKSVDTPTTTPGNETKDDSVGISIGESIESSPDLVLTRVTRRISASGEPILVDSFEGGEGSSVEEITSLRESQEKKTEESPNSNDTGSFKPGSSNDTISISASMTERLSINSDVQFFEDLSETEVPIQGEHKAYIPLQPVTTTSRTYLTENKHDSSKTNDDSYKLFKGVTDDSGKFVSPLYLTSDGKEISPYMARPVYSTPNKIKNELPITPDPCNKKGNALDGSGKCPMNFPSMRRKIAILVEVDALLHHQRGNWHGELTNVMCHEDLDLCAGSWMRSVSSGNLGDVSKSVSPSSSSGSVTQYTLKGSRISMASSNSSGSIASSASTLARMLRDGKVYNSTESIKLTEQRINQLKEKWHHSEEIYKVLDFIDRYALGAENLSTVNSSFKRKESEDESVKEKLCKIEETVTPVSTNKTRPVRAKRQPKVKFASVDSSESEVPKKRQRRAESTDIIPISTNFSAGDSVFAKWGDRKFYAATLGEFTADGKWNVNFFDGDKKLLLEEFLIKAEEFTMVGHSVYASQGDDNFTPGIITGCEVKDGVLQYVVARDKGDISVPCQFIYITESQARQIRGKTTGLRTPTKVAENYGATSKRSTRSKTRMMLDSPKPSSSGTQMAMLSDSDEDGHDHGNEMNLEDVSGVEPESHGLYENGIKLKGKSVTGKMRFARAKVNDVDASVLGPVPDEGSKYFKNIHVLLTCTRPQSPKFQTDAGSNSTDSECYNFSKVPFVKDRLKTQLQMGGATVYNNFDDVPDKMWKSTYLISNRPNISAKYIQCVAAGIRCVCHEWVIRCCVEKKRCPLQELPLGWSLERERFFNSFDRKHSAQIKKLNLLIVETVDKSFYKFWSKVCKLAEISVAKLNRDSNLEQVNAVISESGYRDDHVDRVMSHGIPLVTTTWLIQSILHGEPRPFDNHKNYRADYVDSD